MSVEKGTGDSWNTHQKQSWAKGHSFVHSSQQRPLVLSANTPALKKWGLREVVCGPLVCLAKADKSGIAKYGIDQPVTV